MVELTIGFYGNLVGLSKNLVDMFMKYLCLRHVVR